MSSVSRSVGRPVSRSILAGQSNTLASIIKSLFANGEQGFFYDPNDLSTMYQDAAGTVPVTGAGQPVGLMLDKSKGLHLGQNMAIASTIQGVPLGGSTLTTYTVANNLIVGRVYNVQITVSNYSGTDTVGLAGSSSDAFVLMPPSTRLKSGNGIISFIGVADKASQNLATRSTNTAVFENIQIREVLGNHAYQTTSASRPILRQNVVTGAYYLEFDGSDDFFVTNSIDFTATDKVSLFAGVRKLSDAATGILLELSSSSANNGTFSMLAPPNAGLARYAVSTRGINTTALQASASPHPHTAPISSVLTAKLDNAKGDSAANAIKVRHNGVNMLGSTDGLNSTTPANFGNYPLYIGRQGGTSKPFNGHIYGLIGIGKLTSDNETTTVEKELAKRTGVSLNV